MSTVADRPARFHAEGAALGGIFAASAFVAAYLPTLGTLWRIWTNNPNYSHGFIIAPISLWLAWRKRTELRQAPAAPSWLGALLLIPAAAFQVVGIRGDVAFLQGVSFVMAIAGIVLQLWGWRILSRLLFPIVFLFFMVPTLPWILDSLGFQLKRVAAAGAVEISQTLGVSVARQGFGLRFPDGVLTVENACSGLRSLIALIALGTLIAYLSRCGWVRRGILLCLAIPIAVAANVLRITALCVYAGFAGPDAAAGLFHTVGGYALFVVALALFGAAKRILRC